MHEVIVGHGQNIDSRPGDNALQIISIEECCREEGHVIDPYGSVGSLFKQIVLYQSKL